MKTDPVCAAPTARASESETGSMDAAPGRTLSTVMSVTPTVVGQR